MEENFGVKLASKHENSKVKINKMNKNENSI